ncbi:hypothetical protein HYC85_021747 [Camellia sinensis]|uniref:Uncharacterized protein n=1 Tax=Camellia sinensis TaxID=4442 RepID=A0A7J7GIU1_CAMSI|nr:hypothetical protein HYC85_021747 [Camellia sinensis]
MRLHVVEGFLQRALGAIKTFFVVVAAHLEAKSKTRGLKVAQNKVQELHKPSTEQRPTSIKDDAIAQAFGPKRHGSARGLGFGALPSKELSKGANGHSHGETQGEENSRGEHRVHGGGERRMHSQQNIWLHDANGTGNDGSLDNAKCKLLNWDRTKLVVAERTIASTDSKALAQDCVLRAAISMRGCSTDARTYACRGEDGAALGRNHDSGCVFHAQENTRHVHAQNAFEVGLFVVDHTGFVGIRYAGVVEHDVQFSVGFDSLVDGVLDVVFVGDIAVNVGACG